MATNKKSTFILGFCLLCWIGLFVAGSAVPSDDLLRRAIDSEFPMRTRLLNMAGFVFSWTWSNIMGLCCFASLVGEYGREAMTRHQFIPNPQAALVRGFFIFLAMAAGQLVIVGTISLPPTLAENGAGADAPHLVSAAQYFRIATFCSFLAFFVGFSPKVFTSLLNKIERMAGEEEAHKVES